nr:mitogen-activated protein kinase kinase kinase 17-like [Tanacetum cinerariifolium]
MRNLVGSPGSSTTPCSSPRPSTPTSFSLGPSRYEPGLGNSLCSNCKFLNGKIKVLEVTPEMEMHPENHTLDSTALLHKLLMRWENLFDDIAIIILILNTKKEILSWHDFMVYTTEIWSQCFGEEITFENKKMVYNLFFKFASDGTLADVIHGSSSKGLSKIDVKRYAKSILKGLSHVHKRGSKQVKKKDPGRYWRSNPLYFSPESVISGVQKPPVDIWALGCVVFEMLTGKQLWLAYKDLGKNEVLRRVGYENEIESVISSSSVSNEGQSFLKGCLCKKAARRLSADMLLDHPYLKEFVDDDVNEFDESQGILDINAITSYSSFSDDDGSGYEGSDEEGSDDDGNGDELWTSSDRSSYAFSPWLDRAADARLNEVKIPVRLGLSK